MKSPTKLLTTLALISPCLVTASPVPDPEPHGFPDRPDYECALVDAVVKALTAYSSATPFCSSFLSVPTVTKTITSTASAPKTSTKVSTGITTVTPVITSYTTAVTYINTCISITSLALTTAVSFHPPILLKRGFDHGGHPLPPKIAGYANSEISQACSCLSIPTPTATSVEVVTVSPISLVSKSVRITVSAPASTKTVLVTTISIINRCTTQPQRSDTTSLSTSRSTSLSTSKSTSRSTLNSTSISTTSSTSSFKSTSISTPISNSTSTSPSTFTSTSVSTPNPTFTQCSNRGLEWGYYDNISGDNTDETYSHFKPENYKSVYSAYQAITNTTGGLDTARGTFQSIYGSHPLRSDHLVLNHRGYIFAQQTGTYTFTFDAIDETVYLWIGTLAYIGWEASNANIEVSYRFATQGPGYGTYTIDLVAGRYYPLRVVYAQAQGSGQFYLRFTAPDGSIFLSPDTRQGSPYIVRYSCDGVSAPAFRGSFGAEY